MRTSILLLLFIAGAIAVQAQPQKTLADKIIAVVGDRIILQSDIRNIIDDEIRQGNPLPEGAECSLIEQAMISAILTQQAEKDSLPVTDEDVEIRLDQLVYHFTKNPVNDIDPLQLQQIKESARKQIRERMLAEAMQEKILAHVKITPSEVQAFFDRIPTDSLPFLQSELEIGQIIFYPKDDLELYQSIARLDTVRSKVIAGETTFNKAAVTYSNDDATKYSPFLLNGDGSSHVAIDQLDKEMVMTVSKMKVGDYSQPGSFTNQQGRKGVRFIYFKSRTEPHRLKMKEDYFRISRLALQEKRVLALNKWFEAKMPVFYVVADEDTQNQCKEIRKYVSVSVSEE